MKVLEKQVTVLGGQVPEWRKLLNHTFAAAYSGTKVNNTPAQAATYFFVFRSSSPSFQSSKLY